MPDDTTLKTLIDNSPLSNEDKDHWNSILSKLTDSQKDRLHHSLVAKTNIYAAKAAIERAMKIINEAEAEASEEIDQETVTEKVQEEPMTDKARAELMTDKARAELMKEIDEGNPMMPKKEDLATPSDLTNRQQEADTRLAELRQELANISQEAHGATPPSYQPQS